jgi:hypothetical protein
VRSYEVRVLDGTTVLGQAASGPIDDDFPTLNVSSRSATSVARGGASVEFTTTVDNLTSTSYVDLFSFTTLSCSSGENAVQIAQDAYTLDWYTGGAGWSPVGPVKELGQFSYQLSPGESTTTQFRLAFKDSLPGAVTSCQVTQLVSASDTGSAPFYDTSAPDARAVTTFTVR